MRIRVLVWIKNDGAALIDDVREFEFGKTKGNKFDASTQLHLENAITRLMTESDVHHISIERFTDPKE